MFDRMQCTKPRSRVTISAPGLCHAITRKWAIDVSFLCVCPVIDHEFHHNSVKVAVDPLQFFCDNRVSNCLLLLTDASHEIQMYVFVCILTI